MKDNSLGNITDPGNPMMRSRSKSFCIVSLLFFAAWTQRAFALDLGAMRKSLFKIQVISQTPNYEQPWAQNPTQSSSGTGFYIGKEGIMTNAHVVADGKFITVQRDGDDRPMTARVRFIAHDCDLALLEVQDPVIFKGLKPLTFADFPEVRESVNTIGYPAGGEQLSITQGVVSRVSYRRYVHTGSDSHLLVQVDSAINPGNSGGPVVQKGKVVGVAFQSQTQAENTGYIIPTPVVKRFLLDIKDGHYDGHPVQGFWFMDGALENAATREYHKLKKGDGGVKISQVADHSPAKGALRPGDILLSIEGAPIGVDGKIVFQNERINLRALWDLKQRGDKVKAEILRNGKRQAIQFALTPKGNFYDSGLKYWIRPRFAIVGGLVFSALSRNYLQEWGKGWYYDSPLMLRYAQTFALDIPALQGKRDIVILSERLAHPVNTYAGPFMEEILMRVNGKDVTSVEDIPKIIAAEQSEFLIFEFLDQKTPLVLERESVVKADASIMQQYQVPTASWFGGDDDDGASANWEGEGG
jgi:S1-C subfamily serine protease